MTDSRCCLVVCLSVLAGSAAVVAQDTAVTKSGGTSAETVRIEVIYRDGSKVRMAVATATTIGVATKYGQLTIPISEIGLIRLQPRLTDSNKKKIADAIARMGDSSFARREDASSKLRAMGVQAIP